MPAKMKFTKPPRQNSIGVVSRNLPRHNVATQANTLTPVGTAIVIVVNMNRMRIQFGVPV